MSKLERNFLSALKAAIVTNIFLAKIVLSVSFSCGDGDVVMVSNYRGHGRRPPIDTLATIKRFLDLYLQAGHFVYLLDV